MKKTILSVLLALTAGTGCGQETFNNPMLWADVPDPDVIRVGSDFWLVTTTMHLMPGAPVMHSKDLVNWQTVSYAFDSLHDTPKYDLSEGTVYGRGQWATSIRYKEGKYYMYFSPNDEPHRGYVYTTTDPRKGWTLQNRLPHFHDASLFFDDDGRAYIFYGTGEMQELMPDLSAVREDGLHGRIFERDSTETGLLEGSRVVKHDGKYYLLMISWPAGGKRREVCYRADNIMGPYEKKVILLSEFGGGPYVGQGTIVDDEKGNWYGVIFQDRGGVGRILTLMPCTWREGWPMLGDKDGKVPETMAKPVQGYSGGHIVSSDDFSAKELGIDWQWNHNPVREGWSLTERPGWLRLKTTHIAPNLFLARNTLTQRIMGPETTATVKLDVSGMRDGDVAGFSAFNNDAAQIRVVCEGKRKYIVADEQSVQLTEKEKAVSGITTTARLRQPLKGNTVYIRINANFRNDRDLATLSFSTDGERWTTAISGFKMRFDWQRFFMGTKFAIFNYATKQTGGYVDVDEYRLTQRE